MDNNHQYSYRQILFQVWTEEGEEESEMTCSERLQAELQDDPGGGPPLIPIDPPDPPPSPREQDLTGNNVIRYFTDQDVKGRRMIHEIQWGTWDNFFKLL